MMRYVCNLSVVPLRAEASHRSEMVSQVLFGESFEILEEGKDFSRIRLNNPHYEGWIQNHQFAALTNLSQDVHIVDLLGAKAISSSRQVDLVHGTIVRESIQTGGETYSVQGNLRQPRISDFEEEFPKIIEYYENTPYLWGGRTHAGIDCSGFSQVVYRHFGIDLKRDAYQQAEEGQVVDFLSEIRPGDLAFFDNEAGKITHVGIMIDHETIIHASGRVRIDKMDLEGIFNNELHKYTHKLRIVKRYF